jgi:hypothetical protein
MTNKTRLVLQDYMALSTEESAELRSLIQLHESKGTIEKLADRGRFNEEVKRIMGPTSSGVCLTCGRG